METFDTLDELWIGAIEQLKEGHETSSRDGPTREVIGYVGRLADPTANFMLNPVRKMSPWYAAAELLWYLSGTADISMIKKYAPQYERFAENGKAWGAYGVRWRESAFRDELFKVVQEGKVNIDQNGFFEEGYVVPITQLQAAIWLLKQQQDTRQAVVTMWNSGDLAHALAKDKKDIPCTLSMNFLVRDGKLFLTVTMRSNDVWLGLPYDVWCFTCIQRLAAEALGLELGWYQHQAMSMHLYDRNKVPEQMTFNTGGFKTAPHSMPLREATQYAIGMEAICRDRKCLLDDVNQLGQMSLLQLCVAMTTLKWKRDYSTISWPLLREYVKCLF